MGKQSPGHLGKLPLAACLQLPSRESEYLHSAPGRSKHATSAGEYISICRSSSMKIPRGEIKKLERRLRVYIFPVAIWSIGYSSWEEYRSMHGRLPKYLVYLAPAKIKRSEVAMPLPETTLFPTNLGSWASISPHPLPVHHHV